MTESECDLWCAPDTNFHGVAFDEVGDLFCCYHGVIRRCVSDTDMADWTQRRKHWVRVSPLLTPLQYLQARKRLTEVAIEQERRNR